MHTHCSQGCQTQIHRDKLSFQMGLADLGVQTHQGLGGSFGMCFPIPTAQALPALRHSRNDNSNKEASEVLIKQ